jgi:geranylgeranyl pyrophosphate synthase
MTAILTPLQVHFNKCQAQIEAFLDRYLPKENTNQTTHQVEPKKLFDAIRYSSLSGGKRIRPILSLTAAEALGGNSAEALCAACALELIHVYSLIHDDLPAMDNDDLRRGKPSCHRAFDEATAILAGDALQPLAFEWIVSYPDYSDSQKVKMTHQLAIASGCKGMVSGQAMDLSATGQTITLKQLEAIHRNKTGALIDASLLMGALAVDKTDTTVLEALAAYSRAIGLAFQVQDDILDITSDTDVLGKTQGADIAQNKSTYPSLLGLEGAIALTEKLHNEALNALEQLPYQNRGTDLLAQISQFIVTRNC